MENKPKEKQKKQVPLRLSVNGQIEYLLTECVKHRKRSRKSTTEEPEAE